MTLVGVFETLDPPGDIKGPLAQFLEVKAASENALLSVGAAEWCRLNTLAFPLERQPGSLCRFRLVV